MAKLYAELTSDKGGRVASKGGNEYLITTYKNGNLNIFDVAFIDDGNGRGKLRVMSYCDGETVEVEYKKLT